MGDGGEAVGLVGHRGYVLPTRLAIGLGQGLALAVLWNAGREPWAVGGGPLFAVAYMLALFVPLVPLAALGHMRGATLAIWTLAAAALLVPLTFHDVWRAEYVVTDVAAKPSETLVLLAGTMLFVLHHLIEAADIERRWRPSYSGLVAGSWRHAFQLPLSAGFAFVLWGVLALGSAMFAAIGLKTVASALDSHWLVLPLLGVAFAFAVERTDIKPSLIEGVRRIALMLAAWLLPVATTLVLAFVLALAITGLGPLWATHMSAQVLLWAIAALVVFTNAAYQDGAEAQPVPALVRWSGRVGACLLAPLVALAAVSLELRVKQYGLSQERVQAAVLCAIAAVYAFGYAAAAVSRGAWMRRIEPVNIAAAVLGVVVILLILSPAADPARLAVQSQVGLLRTGVIAPNHFDFAALRFRMTRYGRDALATLAQSNDGGIAQLAQAAQRQDYYGGLPKADPGQPFANAVVRTPGATLPPGFREQPWASLKYRWDVAPCFYSAKPCDLFVIDLDGDGRPEILSHTDDRVLKVYARDPSGTWRNAGVYYLESTADDLAALAAGHVATIPPRFDDLRIGDERVAYNSTAFMAIAKSLGRPLPPPSAPAPVLAPPR